MKKRRAAKGRGCPHGDAIQFCPLYVAAHSATLVKFGCAGPQLDIGRCEADRYLDYDTRVARLRAEWPGFVAEREDAREAHERAEQRRRNLRRLNLN